MRQRTLFTLLVLTCATHANTPYVVQNARSSYTSHTYNEGNAIQTNNTKPKKQTPTPTYQKLLGGLAITALSFILYKALSAPEAPITSYKQRNNTPTPSSIDPLRQSNNTLRTHQINTTPETKQTNLFKQSINTIPETSPIDPLKQSNNTLRTHQINTTPEPKQTNLFKQSSNTIPTPSSIDPLKQSNNTLRTDQVNIIPEPKQTKRFKQPINTIPETSPIDPLKQSNNTLRTDQINTTPEPQQTNLSKQPINTIPETSPIDLLKQSNNTLGTDQTNLFKQPINTIPEVQPINLLKQPNTTQQRNTLDPPQSLPQLPTKEDINTFYNLNQAYFDLDQLIKTQKQNNKDWQLDNKKVDQWVKRMKNAWQHLPQERKNKWINYWLKRWIPKKNRIEEKKKELTKTKISYTSLPKTIHKGCYKTSSPGTSSKHKSKPSGKTPQTKCRKKIGKTSSSSYPAAWKNPTRGSSSSFGNTSKTASPTAQHATS